jgi:xanthine/CO dehydrogenase XdhC/CoxF family maturation factor
MKELKDIIQAFDQAQKEGKQTALATVVQVEGSSYRRPGARMLVTEDGQLTGAISGGCLEGDALRKALLVMAQRKPMLVTYDTMDEDDAVLGVGLGCNGIIHILIEPVDTTSENHPIELIRMALRSRESAVLVTLFSLEHKKGDQPGTCFLYTKKGSIIFAQGRPFANFLVQEAEEVSHQESSVIKRLDKSDVLSAFVEWLPPPIALICIGGGNDVQPLVEMSAVLGWHITVVDGRKQYATKQRFPKADKILVAKAPDVLSHLDLDNRSIVLLMTHNYNYDLAVLQLILPLGLPYIGILGPKKKMERMLNELKENGINITDEQLQRLFGPVGLDIGAETSEEIALSIVAEIKKVLSKKTGTSLREKKGFIHT